MKKFITHSHDKIFRLSLSNIVVVKDFLTQHLPGTILKIINLNSLTICPNSYISPALKEKFSDILYRVTTTKKVDCYIYTLIEHQSTPVWDMPLRMVQYQLAVIESHLRQYPKAKKLPIVIPLLVYNGDKKPYPYNLDLIDLFNDPDLARKTFGKSAKLLDLTQISDHEIQKHKIVGLLEFTLKHVHDRRFEQQTKLLAQIIDNLVVTAVKIYRKTTKLNEFNKWLKDYIAANLHYVYYFANIINNADFYKELSEINFIKRENIMGTLAQKIEEEGFSKAHKNMAIKLIKKGLPIETIAEVTELSLSEIEQLKSKESKS